MVPFLYQNGGPIIMVQVENEYGSYGTRDVVYQTHLRDTFRKYLGNDTVLFTTDGDGESFLRYGKISDVFATCDFGSGGNLEQVKKGFDILRRHQSKGPLVNSEYYSGWLDHWGQRHSMVSGAKVSTTLDYILQLNASVNM